MLGALSILRRVRREIEFGCILQNEHDRMFVDPCECCLVMWFENRLRCDGVIIQQPIRGQRVTPLREGSINTRLRIRAECVKHVAATFIQSFVSQVDPQQFIRDLFRQCSAPGKNGRLISANLRAQMSCQSSVKSEILMYKQQGGNPAGRARH